MTKDYHTRAIRKKLQTQGWVVIHTGPNNTQRAGDLLRKRIYGSAICLKQRASTFKEGNYIIGIIR